MYHTEGYLDQNTYFAKGHIWGNAIEHQGSICYVWCVSEQKMAAEAFCHEADGSVDFERTDNAVKRWIHQELAVALGKGQVSIQKELNRFRAFTKKKLYLYYRGHFFADGNDDLWQFLTKGIGIFVSPTVSRLPEFGQLLQAQGVISGEEITGKCADVNAEQLGNRLKTVMLRAMSEGKFEQGYFFIWEDENAF